ncbi:MAG: hypothetical protein KF900_06485 [Bacteroidetes bacterium]|nr:hypothetical protein [Bacteroidota bacterium]
MQSENYRENLEDALRNLLNVYDSIYASIVNVVMQGELKEWNDIIEIGEEYNISYELLKSCDDTNVLLLVELLDKIETTLETLKNINGME